ncbi:Hsp20/alpha crystallin family protein [Dictyobacter kobayashii]|uniref:Heat-shock protein Hsp20 n=1 Tax=Dictyobacter kobayashii TaxID=2014872 RepID=A0A402ADA7_9CHLR|nr:Hsp20/alpha crystallin family protein [Dictyobacter kobayashii]GCE17075.1 heat-shock protein Hsp20 [Dictyobacter kobayashii]
MSMIMRHDPFRDFVSLRNAMDQLFEQSFVRPTWEQSSQGVRAVVDAYETEQGYHIRALLPGVKPEDIELTVQDNTLYLKGILHPWNVQEEKANWLVQESGSGKFERSITFPKPINADGIETSYEHGVLTITAPVVEESRPRKITVSSGKAQPKQMVESGTNA